MFMSSFFKIHFDTVWEVTIKMQLFCKNVNKCRDAICIYALQISNYITDLPNPPQRPFKGLQPFQKLPRISQGHREQLIPGPCNDPSQDGES